MPRRQTDKSESDRIANILSQRLRAFRTARAWTQEMAAERVGLSTEAYARLERGHSLPSYPTLARICDKMETTPDVLLGYTREDLESRLGSDDDSEHDQLVRRIASKLSDLDPTVVDGVGRLVAALWRNERD